MNALLEKSKLELPEEFTIRRLELGGIKPALKPCSPTSGLPPQKSFARRIVTRWKTLGYDLRQCPAQNKSGSKIKRPHG